jgi:hypothetical protein
MNNQPNEIESVGAIATQANVAAAASQLITLEPAKYVAEVFKPFNDKFEILKAEADTIAPDASTPAGMEICVKYRAAFRDDVRVAGEKARVERKAPILTIGKLLDTKYAELKNAVVPYEAKFDSPIKAEEKRKDDMKRAEAEREEKVRLRIVAIRDLPLAAVGKSAAVIAEMIAALETDVPDESFGKLLDAATTARAEVQVKLAGVYAAAVASEDEAARIAAERAELAQLREAAAERARVAQAEAARVAAEQKAEAERLAALAAEQEAAALREREAAAAKLKLEADAQAERNRQAQADIDRQLKELADAKAAAQAEREAAERSRVAAATKAQLEQQAAQVAAQRAAEDATFAGRCSVVAVNSEANDRAAALAEQGRLTDLAADLAPAILLPVEIEVREAAPASPPTLRLGQIGERLGFTVTADFLLSLGFAPAATDKAAKLYHELDFPRICAVLTRHIGAVQAKYATDRVPA